MTRNITMKDLMKITGRTKPALITRIKNLNIFITPEHYLTINGNSYLVFSEAEKDDISNYMEDKKKKREM